MQKQPWSEEAAKRELRLLIGTIPKSSLPESPDAFVKKWINTGEHEVKYLRGTRISVIVVMDEALLDGWDIRNSGRQPSFEMIYNQYIKTKMPSVKTEHFIAALLYSEKHPRIIESLDYYNMSE